MELLNTVEQSWNQNRLHALLKDPYGQKKLLFKLGSFKFGDPSLFWDLAMLSCA